MPVIEKIIPCSGGKSVMVTLSDGQKCRIYKPVLQKLAVTAGCEAPEALLRLFEAKLTSEKARDYAAKAAMRPIFSSEMEKKLLEKGFSAEIAADTISWLTRIGALNDEETLCVYLREAARKGKGSRQIVYDLMRRGISRETVEAAMKDYKADDAALSILKKKLGGASDRDALRRASAYLFSKGFSREEIAAVLEKYLSDAESND